MSEQGEQYYRRALFGWIPVSRAQYLDELTRANVRLARVEAAPRAKVLVRRCFGWVELWLFDRRLYSTTLTGEWRERLEAFADERGLEIVWS